MMVSPLPIASLEYEQSRGQGSKGNEPALDNAELGLNPLPRVYTIIDTATLARLSFDAVAAASALIEGGARLLQFRHKSFWSREVFAQASEIAHICRAADADLIVNDRSDYASLLGAGVHLGQDDLLPGDARRVVGPAAIMGLSTHNAEQMIAAQREPVDYFAFGPLFGTSSKERPDPQVGLEGLRLVRGLTSHPLVAIGGINRGNAAWCWSAGADTVAVIADVFPHPCTRSALRSRMEEWSALAAAYPRVRT